LAQLLGATQNNFLEKAKVFQDVRIVEARTLLAAQHRLEPLFHQYMRRCRLYAAFATAGEPYGAWLLEYPQSSVITLAFKRSVALNNEVTTSELGFICE
jgi:hypothetical protein